MLKRLLAGRWSVIVAATAVLLGGAGQSPPAAYPPANLPSFANFDLPFTTGPSSVSQASLLQAPAPASPDTALAQVVAAPSAADFQSCDSQADKPTQAIVDLATSLKNDPGLIFHYVHDNIDLDFGVESSKGALGTYLDRNGSSFDQTALLLALLQAAAVSNTQISQPQIVIGVVPVNGGTFGLPNVSTSDLAKILEDSGVDQQTATNNQMPYAWVQVLVNGQQVIMDPANKTYVTFTGTNFSGYQPAAPTANTGAIDTYLSLFASNIYAANRANYGSLTNFIGGRRQQPLVSGQYYNVYNPSGRTWAQLVQTQNNGGVAPSATPAAYTYMPFTYRMTFKSILQNGQGGKTTQYLCLDQIYGHNVLIYYTNLVVDTVTIASGNGSASFSTDTFAVFHQVWANGQITYPWVQSANEININTANGAVIQFAVGHVGSFRAQEAAKLAEYAESPGVGATSLKLNSIGASQLAQTAHSLEILDQLAGVVTCNHHMVEFVHYTGGAQIWQINAVSLASVDIPLTATSAFKLSNPPQSGLSVASDAVPYALSALQSAQEAAALQQANVQQPVSAATLMASSHGSNTQPTNMIHIAPGQDPYANSTIRSAYTTTQIATLEAYAQANYDLVVPDIPSPWTTGTNAMAFLASQGGGTSGFVLQTPNGVYKGASSTSPVGGDGTTPGIGGNQLESGPLGSGLAVNTSSGEVSFSAPLLSIGSAGSPYSLGLSISYSSDPANQLSYGTGFAPGWSHNYYRKLNLATDPSALIGSDLAIPSITGVAALYYLLQNGNLLSAYYGGQGSYPTSAVFASSVAAGWFLQMATNDVVSITRGGSNEPFTKLPNGTYQTLTPSGEQLLLSGSNLVWYAPNHNTETYPSTGGPISQAYMVTGETTTFSYAACGPNSLLNKVSTIGHSLTFNYRTDPNSNACLLYTVNDETGRSVSFGYSSLLNDVVTLSQLSSINLVDGKTLTPGYTGAVTGEFWPGVSSASLLGSVKDPMTFTASVGYDSRFVGTHLTNPNSHTTTYYIADGRSEVDDAMGNVSYQVTWPLLYYVEGLVTDSYDPLQKETVSVYNYAGQLISKTLPDTPAGGYNYSYGYDSHGNLSSTSIGPSGSTQLVTSTYWDPVWNKPDTITDAKGNVTTYHYQPVVGTLTSVQEPSVPCSGGANCQNGQVAPTTSYTYNGSLVTSVTGPDGEVTTYSYDPAGKTGDLWTVVVDSGSTPHLNLTTQVRYDAVGNVISIQTPNGNTTTATLYDAARRLKTKNSPPLVADQNASLPTNYVYDNDGRLQTIAQGTGQTIGGVPQYLTTTTGYDNAGNVTSRTIPTTGSAVRTTTYTYDLDERLSLTTDPANQATMTTYDADSRPWQVEQQAPGGGSMVVTQTTIYNGDGLPYQITDGNGHTTQYNYDNYDRLYQTVYADTTTETLTLDKDGTVTQRVDRSGNTFVYTPDALERETSETDTAGVQGQAGYSKSFAYDTASRVLALNGTGGNFTYAYDTAGRQTQINYGGITANGDQPYSVGYTYDPDGNKKTITYPTGYLYTYGYGSIDELLTVGETAPNTSGVTNLVSYTWNTLGSLTNAAFSNGTSTSYANFDQYDHPQQINHTLVGASLTINYTLDNDERRAADSFSDSSWVWHPPAAATSTYTPTTLNQYSAINGQSLSYGANGTLTGDPTAPLGSATYGWDMFNRLTTVQNTQNITYAYDTMGRRSQKAVGPIGGQQSYNSFAYDGDQAILVYGSATLPASAQLAWVYGVGNTPFLQETMANSGGVESVTQHFYLHTDALGTPLSFSNGPGYLNNKYPTSPWGELTSSSGTPFHFAGMYYDSETGLYYDHARYYSPQQGRFISPDPIGIKGGINIYAYTENDPINGTDPTGLCGPTGSNCPNYLVTGSNLPQDPQTYSEPVETIYGDPFDGGGGGVNETGDSMVWSHGPSTYSDVTDTYDSSGFTTNESFTVTGGQGYWAPSGSIAPGLGIGSYQVAGTGIYATNGEGPNKRGNIAVQQIKSDLAAEGFSILGEQVSARVPGLTYGRRYDLAVRPPGDPTIFGVEVKSTMGQYYKLNAAQVFFDSEVVRVGASSAVGSIGGVMYRGVCFGCGVGAAWESLYLLNTLDRLQIPYRTIIAPTP